MALLLAPLRIAAAVVGLLSGNLNTGAPAPVYAAPFFDLVFAAFRRVENFLVDQPPAASPTQTSQSATGVITGALHATDSNGDPLRYTVTANPLHGTVNVTADGSYTYTPTTAFAHTGGTDTFTVTGDDSAGFHLFAPAGHTTAIPVLVTVTPVNHTPTVNVSALHNSDGTTTLTVTTNDTDADVVTTTVTALDGHGTLNATATGYRYTPNADYAHSLSAGGTTTPGTDAVTITANDAHGGITTSAPTGVRIDAVNTAPTLTVSAAGDHTAGVTTLTVTTTDPDTPSSPDTVTVSVSTYPTHGALTAQPDGTYRYTPQTGYTGTDSVTLAATDEHGGQTQHSITLDPTNHAPTLTVTPTVNTDGTTTLTVTVTDLDADGVNTTAASANGDGTLASITGGYLYTPAASSTRSTDTVTITAIDTHGAAAASMNTVAAIPPLTASAPTITVAQPDPTTGVVTGTVHVTGSEVTYTLSTPPPPSQGTVTLEAATGAFTYTPTVLALYGAYTGQAGTSTTAFTITATNGQASIPVAVSVPVGVPTDALIAMLQRLGSRPSAVAIGPDGTVYLTNSGANTLTIINPITTTKTTVSVGLSPTAAAVGPDGHVWVVNSGDDTVSVLNANGTSYLGSIRVGQAPSGIAFGADGNAYVTNSADGTVSIVDPNGRGIIRTVTVGTNPLNLASGPDGRVYVANYGDGTLTIIEPGTDYTATTVSAGATHPYGIAVTTTGSVYVTDPVANTLSTLTPMTSGGFVSTTVTIAGGPSAITVGPTGQIYITDANVNTMTTIDPATGTTTTITVGAQPLSVAVAPNGSIYTANSGDDTLTTITPDSNTAQSVNVGVDVSTITVGGNNELLAINNYDHALTVLPIKADASINYDVERTAANSPLYSSYGIVGSQVGDDGTLYTALATLQGTSLASISIVGVRPNGQTTVDNFYGTIASTSKDVFAVASNGRVYILANGRLNVADFSGGGTYAPAPQIVMETGAEQLKFGSDGRVYLFDSNKSIMVLNPDFTPAARIDVSPTSSANYSGSLRSLSFSNGRIYALETYADNAYGGNPSTNLVVINPDISNVTRVPLGLLATDMAVGTDGRVYITTGASAITVLNPDFDFDRTVPIGLQPSEITVGPDGNIFVTAGTSIVAIDKNDYSLGSIYLSYQGNAGDVTGLVSGAAGVYATTLESGGYGATVNRITTHVPPTPDTNPPTGTTDPVSSQPIVLESAPDSTAALYQRLRERTDTTKDNNNGIYIERVLSDIDQKQRLIVYLGGTDPQAGTVRSNVLSVFNPLFAFTNFGLGGGSGQTISNNIVSASGALKEYQITLINSAIDDCPQCAGIMLVGYSQGGIDAQNLALRKYDTPNTTVVTFGSPIIQLPGNGQPTVHIQDVFDPVPHLFLNFNQGLLSLTDPSLLNAIYSGISGSPLRDVHGDESTYETLGHEFDYIETDAKYLTVKNSIANFEGNVVGETKYRDYRPPMLPTL